MMGRRRQVFKVIMIVFVTMMSYYAFFLLPDPLFKSPYSTILQDRSGELLGAAIADDGQWRFPLQDSVPAKYRIAVLTFEDRRFERHFGVDPLALARAIRENIKAGRVVSGGSTITMQVIKLSRKDEPRTYAEKAIELLMASRLELSLSKDEIFAHYAAHAPFGGNVVGLEAACWRYFGHRPSDLSWGEAALLAVLPNNPSLLRPGKNQGKLKMKRDRLLARLAEHGYLSKTDLALSISEAIPNQPLPLPRTAPHLLDRAMQEGLAQQRVTSTLDAGLQKRAQAILNRHHERLSGNQIHNAAALILDVRSGEVLAYVGNTPAGSEHQEQVDIIRAPRSTGSVLKPFLFSAAIDEGLYLPGTLMPDIPTSIDGFAPRNFSHAYDGAVALDQALIRSLNIPFVHVLQSYRYEKLYTVLKKAGIRSINKPADHYGLSLILGGAEATLWEITGAYAAVANQLNWYGATPFAVRKNATQPEFKQFYVTDATVVPSVYSSPTSVAASWLTVETLRELYRPGEEMGWKSFNSSKPIAWKTGTSFGFRDGWAIGITPGYAVGVWTGNADGEGRPGLVGTETAAPILFELFAQLPGQEWFRQPIDEMEFIAVCPQSGQRLGMYCPPADSAWVTPAGLRTPPCRFHKVVHLSRDGKVRVNANCASQEDRVAHNWFVLPPVQEHFYRAQHVTYKPLPLYRSSCTDPMTVATMDLVYPKPDAKIFVPRELDGTSGATIFEVAHRSRRAKVFWHLDGEYLGATSGSHKMVVAPVNGPHVLNLVDENGQYLTRTFTVTSKQ